MPVNSGLGDRTEAAITRFILTQLIESKINLSLHDKFLLCSLLILIFQSIISQTIYLIASKGYFCGQVTIRHLDEIIHLQ